MGDHMGCELRSTSTKMLSTTLWTPLQCGVFSRGLLVMVVNFLQKDKIMKYLLASSFNPTQLLVSESWLTASSSQALAVSLEGSSSPEVNTSMIIAETKFWRNHNNSARNAKEFPLDCTQILMNHKSCSIHSEVLGFGSNNLFLM